MWVLLLTLVAVAATVVDVIRRPQEAWTSGRERTAWLVLLLVPAVVTLASFSFVGPLLAVVVVVAYCASRWGRKRARSVYGPALVGVVAVVAILVVSAFLVTRFVRADWGTPTRRVASPTGEFEVVQYEWTAMIDPAWNLAIERVDGDDREWFWRSVEGPAPTTISFVGPTSIEVADAFGGRYRVDFDPDSLTPSDRYCLNPGYCYDDPWDDYTRDAP